MSTEQKPGFFRAENTGVLLLRGDDAGEFLNGQVSNAVANLADGDSKYALLLTPKGKIRAEMTIARDGDETLVVCAAAQLATIVKTIETFRIGYFFSVEDASDQFVLIQLVADDPSQAEQVVAQLSIPVVELESPLGVDLLVEAAEADQLEGELVACGAQQLGQGELDAARVTRSVPRVGAELTEDTFPAEAGLETRAVSFEKGCYVGQETVARMHYKGHPNRQLRILSAEQPLTAGSTVSAEDGRELGTVGTAALAPDGRNVALAILRREAETGAVVDVGGVAATIVEVQASTSVK